MEADDFQMPSPKRQRTNSLEENRKPPTAEAPMSASEEIMTTHPGEHSPSKGNNGLDTTAVNDEVQIPGLGNVSESENNTILDALMLHVESESQPKSTNESRVLASTYNNELEDLQHTESSHIFPSIPETPAQELNHVGTDREGQKQPASKVEDSTDDQNMEDATDAQTPIETVPDKSKVELPLESSNDQKDKMPAGLPATDERTIEHLRAVAEVNGIPPTSDTLVEEQVPQEKEWETDSSPYESSDGDSSSDSSSSDDDSDEDDEDAEGEYTMMDALEQARILMEDGGSDDEGERSNNRTGGTGIRTANERPEEIFPKPDITVTEVMAIEELGHVENIVENVLLIKAKVSGEYQVLESGSLLCLADRSVIGVVSETLGRVEQPLYTVRFGSETDIKDSGVSEKGTRIFYVQQHSTFVFTQPLKAIKGSDASNFHDEEVGDEEMEFSDDEAEAEHKRQMKLKRRGIDPNQARGRGSGRGRGSHRGGRGGYYQNQPSSESNGTDYGSGSLEMNYDEVEEGETGYTPLQRPANLHEMMGNNQPVEDPVPPSYPPMQNGGMYRRGRGNDRGHRGHRGGGNRGGRGGGAFKPNHNNRPNYQQPNYQDQHRNAYSPPMAPPQLSFATPPAAPNLTPQNPPGYQNSTFSPSPISPLPKSQFNFPPFGPNMGSFPQQQQPPPAMVPDNRYQQMWQNWQSSQQQYQHQQYNGWSSNMANPHGNATAGTAWQQTGNQMPGNQQIYANNADAVAQVQQHLNELSKGAGGRGGADGSQS